VAQSPGLKTEHYSKDGLSFEYSEGWSLSEKSSELAQHLLLTREGSSARIMILAYRYLVISPEQLAEHRRDVTELYINQTTKLLQTDGGSVKREDSQLKVGKYTATGLRLQGTSNRESTTAEIYSFLGKLRFINLAYIRADRESPQDDPAWTTLLNSLEVATPLIGSREQGGMGQEFPEKYLEGRALSLPYPSYPPAAISNHIAGVVLVRVIVDENGNVSDVYAASGPPALIAASKTAALRARFTPTVIAGQPVRVTGTITYRFVPR
jgi:TonB family protein